MGLISATIRLTGTAPSSSKSPLSFPNGSRAGRSRLVQVVRTVSASTFGPHGPRGKVHQRKEHVRAFVVAVARGASRRAPEGLLLGAAHAVAVRIERLELHHFAGSAGWRSPLRRSKRSPSPCAGSRPAPPGYSYAVWSSRMGSAVCAKQVDDGSAVQPEGLRADPQLQHLPALGALKRRNHKHDFRPVRRSRPPQIRSSPVRSRKKNFCGKQKYSCNSR